MIEFTLCSARVAYNAAISVVTERIAAGDEGEEYETAGIAGVRAAGYG